MSQPDLSTKFQGLTRPLALICKWTEPLAGFSAQMLLQVVLQDRLHSFSDAVFRLPVHMGLEAIFSSRCGFKFVSLPWQSSRTASKASKSRLGTQIRQLLPTKLPGQTVPPAQVCRWTRLPSGLSARWSCEVRPELVSW